MAQLIINMVDNGASPDLVVAAQQWHVGDVVAVVPDDYVFGNLEPGPMTLLIQIPGASVDDFLHLVAEERSETVDVLDENGILVTVDGKPRRRSQADDERATLPRKRTLRVREVGKLGTEVASVKVNPRYDRKANQFIWDDAEQLAHVANGVSSVDWIAANIEDKAIVANPAFVSTAKAREDAKVVASVLSQDKFAKAMAALVTIAETPGALDKLLEAAGMAEGAKP